MNVLKMEKKRLVVRCLVDGMSIRAIERVTGVHRDTTIRLMVKLGKGCATLLDEAMRGLDCKRLEVDELWSFVQKKQKAVKKQKDPNKNKDYGDTWVFIALDPDSKIVPSHLVGKRTLETANEFMEDLGGRMLGRIQMTSDGLKSYVESIEQVFGGDIDYAQIVKEFEADEAKATLPPRVYGAAYIGREPIYGKPNPRYISTSMVERQNLTMRMGMRRFTRKTNGFSKKLENHKAAVALHFGYYNLARPHLSIKVAPAVKAGVISETWGVTRLIEEAEEAEQANERESGTKKSG